jgi:hypothetical protein
MHKLLDVTDRSVRRLQLAAVGASALLVGLAGVLLASTNAPVWATVLALIIGVVGFVTAGGIRQRWELDYKGHHIQFENSPLTGERLFLDGGLVSRGGMGQKMELRAPIRVGDGAGEEIMALVDAGILQIRLRVYVEGAAAGAGSLTPGASAAVAPPATATPIVTSVTHSGALGKLVMARRVVEFIGSVITIVTTASAVILWLLRG